MEASKQGRLTIAEGAALLSLDGGVARLTLNRPEASNGMNIELLEAFNAAILMCHGKPEVRVLLISGAGPNFCAGGDVRVFAAQGTELPRYVSKATALLQRAVLGLIRLDAPVIAAVHGFAAGGGGFGLVCAADMVVAAQSAKFLSGATRVAMAPDAGASVTLARLVGHRKAMEILLTSPTIGAEEARDLGIVNRVVPDGELPAASLALARELAAMAPKALAATKRLVWNGVASSVEACLPEEARTVTELSGTADAREGLAAVIERRAPKFTGK
ncbi:MAG: enoyl-CoA hydratase-related protein [Rhodospirillales bacterium]